MTERETKSKLGQKPGQTHQSFRPGTVTALGVNMAGLARVGEVEAPKAREFFRKGVIGVSIVAAGDDYAGNPKRRLRRFFLESGVNPRRAIRGCPDRAVPTRKTPAMLPGRRLGNGAGGGDERRDYVRSARRAGWKARSRAEYCRPRRRATGPANLPAALQPRGGKLLFPAALPMVGAGAAVARNDEEVEIGNAQSDFFLIMPQRGKGSGRENFSASTPRARKPLQRRGVPSHGRILRLLAMSR